MCQKASGAPSLLCRYRKRFHLTAASRLFRSSSTAERDFAGIAATPLSFRTSTVLGSRIMNGTFDGGRVVPIQQFGNESRRRWGGGDRTWPSQTTLRIMVRRGLALVSHQQPDHD